MKIYTKKGDGGETSLLGGTRVPKHHLRIEAYGTVDELNSFIGMIRDKEVLYSQRTLIKTIQDKLFTLGSLLAVDPAKTNVKLPEIDEQDVYILERSIDILEKDLPALTNFVLPGGHPVNSLVHVTRCVCRRAERHVVRLNEIEAVNPLIIKYLNRLSDWLFVLARYISHITGSEELKWEGN